MKIIISPAKQMRVDTDSFACTELPAFMEKTEVLKDWISGLTYEQQKALWACNDKIARGEMVRFMAGIHAEKPEQMKEFNWSGYCFDEERSSETEYVFIRTEIPGKGKQ